MFIERLWKLTDIADFWFSICTNNKCQELFKFDGASHNPWVFRCVFYAAFFFLSLLPTQYFFNILSPSAASRWSISYWALLRLPCGTAYKARRPPTVTSSGKSRNTTSAQSATMWGSGGSCLVRAFFFRHTRLDTWKLDSTVDGLTLSVKLWSIFVHANHCSWVVPTYFCAYITVSFNMVCLKSC